jgi:tetratricopeptide (TPR) repeat protein
MTLPSGAPPASDEPQAIAHEADELFAAKQYDRAAALYARLVALDPSNADLYNNLGLTLHYLGRSDEALARLAEGAALDPRHQRLWLTTGFVNQQLGREAGAREALQKAASVGEDAAIRDSAEKMLASLPDDR